MLRNMHLLACMRPFLESLLHELLHSPLVWNSFSHRAEPSVLVPLATGPVLVAWQNASSAAVIAFAVRHSPLLRCMPFTSPCTSDLHGFWTQPPITCRQK